MARYYNPNLGRFLSLDPDPEDSDDPITQNGYTYANNNPVMSVDPDGNWVIDAMWLVGDLASFAATPSLAGAGWLAADVASFADPTGAFTSVTHAGKALKGAGRLLNSVEKYHAFPKYLGGNSKQLLYSMSRSSHRQLHRDLREFAPTSRKCSTAYYKNLKHSNRQAYNKILKKTYKYYDNHPDRALGRAFKDAIRYSNKYGYFR